MNVTPDSFSDGGAFLEPERAVRRAVELVGEGADIIELGGESTRPGASPVSADEEVARIAPVLDAARRELPTIPIAVDTVKGAVARRALDAGASIINDVSALRVDPEMVGVCAAHGAGLVLMHSRGDVADMASYRHATYGQDAVAEIVRELASATERAAQGGVAREQIVVDPGIGFSKRGEHSVAALMELERVAVLGFPVMVGTSRKRFLGELSGIGDAKSRLSGTIAANVLALSHGARLFRVHDVRHNREALSVAWGMLTRRSAS